MSGSDIIRKIGYCLSSLSLMFFVLCSMPHSKAAREVITSGKCPKFYEDSIVESKEAPWWNQGSDTCHICNSINNRKSWFITKFLRTNNAELVHVDITVSFTDCPECKNQHLKIFAVHENLYKRNMEKSEMIANLEKSTFLKVIKNEKSGKSKTHNIQFASHSHGVSIVFLTEGACLMIHNIKVSSFVCEKSSVEGVRLPKSVSPACGNRMVNSSCFSNTVASSERVFGLCGSDGEWKFVTPCVCKEGFTFGGSQGCHSCPRNTYKARVGNDPCLPCPSNSESAPQAVKCQCKQGFHRSLGDKDTGACRGTCQDKSKQCQVYSGQGFCASNHLLHESMKTNCPEACGFCKVLCQDKNRYCQNYSDRGYCESSHKYHKYMKRRCPKTCEFCGLAAACADTNSICPHWKQFCKLYPRVKRSCKKTCGTC